ncbi:histidine kinase, partial [Streptomyces sp. NRRL B-1568]
MLSLLSYAAMTLLNILDEKLDASALAVALVGLCVISLLQYLHSTPEAQRRLRIRKSLTLGAQAVFTYLPIVAYGHMWGSMAGFLAGSLLLLLPPRPAWALYGAVGASM